MLKKAITEICIEYVDIFSRTLSDIHEDIPRLEFDIDLENGNNQIILELQGYRQLQRRRRLDNKSLTCWQLRSFDLHNNSTTRKCILLLNQRVNADFA